jgi:hypothetical protein
MSDDDEDQTNSELAEALIRLCPHLSPELQQAVVEVVQEATKVTLH